MAEVRNYVKPQTLYRYRSLKDLDREVNAIERGYLFCSPYMKLNDPMEGLFGSSQHLRASDDYREIIEEIRNNKERTGICSFSEVHDQVLMWAHYADQFRGICIGYNFSKLLQNLAKDVSFVRMYYSEKVPTVRRTDRTPKHWARMILSYKNYRWLYEREWRMFAPLGEAFYRKAGCVSRVYLGYRMKDSDRRQLTGVFDRLGIESSEMTIDKYSIGFEPSS